MPRPTEIKLASAFILSASMGLTLLAPSVVAGPMLAYVQTRMGPSGHCTWQFIGGIRYVVR